MFEGCFIIFLVNVFVTICFNSITILIIEFCNMRFHLNALRQHNVAMILRFFRFSEDVVGRKTVRRKYVKEETLLSKIHTFLQNIRF